MPGVGWLAYFEDPQGNAFGLIQEEKRNEGKGTERAEKVEKRKGRGKAIMLFHRDFVKTKGF